MATIMAIKARDLNIDINESSLSITKIMDQNPRRVGEVRIEFIVCYDQMNDLQKNDLEKAALNCPVAKSVHPELIQSVEFKYHKKTPI